MNETTNYALAILLGVVLGAWGIVAALLFDRYLAERRALAATEGERGR